MAPRPPSVRALLNRAEDFGIPPLPLK